MPTAFAPCPHCGDTLPVYRVREIGSEWDRWFLVSAGGVVFESEDLDGSDCDITCATCDAEITNAACTDCGGEIDADRCRDCARDHVSVYAQVLAAFGDRDRGPSRAPFYEIDCVVALPNGRRWNGRLQVESEADAMALVERLPDSVSVTGVRPAVIRSVDDALAVIEGLVAQSGA